MKRDTGVLLSITSLPSKYGIGCFDEEAYKFVDWLEKSGQTYWQILPLGAASHTGAFDSPYQAFSAFAGNPYFISLDALVEEGVLTREEVDAVDFGSDPNHVDYDKLYANRLPLLHKAYERSNVSGDWGFREFCNANFWWLDDYALFMALKKENGGKCRAINYGVDRAEGELFFNVDSDDYLTDDALEKVAAWVETLPRDGSFCGVVGNLGTSPDYTPNTPIDGPWRDGNLLERYDDYTANPIDGERAPVFFTEIQRKYKYPEFEGEKFVTPAVTWNRMAADGYKVRIFDDIIWIYEYQPDGLTANVGRNFIKNPQGAGIWQREKAQFLGDPLKKKMKMWYTFYCDHTACDEAYRLTAKQCAEYIGAPRPFMWVVAALRAVKGLIRK